MAIATPYGNHHININRLRGITPTAAIWDVNPTNLDRCTDMNWLNMTGVGNKNVGAWAEVGNLKFDMGAIYNVLVRAKYLLGNNVVGGANCVLEIEGSEDDATYYETPANAYHVVKSIANTQVTYFTVAFIRGRYLILRWRSYDVAGIFYGAVWEVQAIDHGL